MLRYLSKRHYSDTSAEDITLNTSTQQTDTKQFKPLRVWIPAILLPCMVIVRFIPDWVENGPSMIWATSAFGPFLIAFVILVWWLLLSRARFVERIVGLLGIIGIIAIVSVMLHSSMQGPLIVVMTIPMAIAGFAACLVMMRNSQTNQRTYFALLVALLMAAVSLLFKTDGVWGNFAFNLDWRWKQSAEERLLLERESKKTGSEKPVIPISELAQSDWPRFRGPLQNSTQSGRVFVDNWVQSPPKELWRTRVGPAWSSFSVVGNYLFTQEQRGENECIVCYDATNGEQVWEQGIASRFFEALGGLGPRATPTFAEGFIYTLGAEGNLLKLRADDGSIVWRVDLHKLSGRATTPMWGYSCSPLVYGGIVVLHAGGPADKGILAFDTQSGEMKWSVSAGQDSYATVQLMQLLGQTYFVLLSEFGAHFISPPDGSIALNYEWKHMGYRSLQPQVLDGDKVLIPTGMGMGTRLIQLNRDGAGALQAAELWTTLDMKPDYNDVLVHKGFAYGFDNAIFACIDLQTGKRKWKGGRYAKGQALLLADSDLIIVVSEGGELVLVRATPDKLEELGRVKAFESKTWNHPVVVGDRLYVRNSEEAVCYQLATAVAH
jgi:outer membrane protein assembly factor BamB